MLARRGMFIVVEGLDRTGKSTQAKKLAEALTERAKAQNPDAAACLQFNYPNRQSQSGQLLDQYLQRKTGDDMGNEAVHLLFSMNRWENKNWVVQQLANGTNLVCDRYAYSGVAYSVAKVSEITKNLISTPHCFRDWTSTGVQVLIVGLSNPTSCFTSTLARNKQLQEVVLERSVLSVLNSNKRLRLLIASSNKVAFHTPTSRRQATPQKYQNDGLTLRCKTQPQMRFIKQSLAFQRSMRELFLR